VGHVIEGLEVVDQIKKGSAARNGIVDEPDYIAAASVEE
jgi:peptidylprolyl isomerase